MNPVDLNGEFARLELHIRDINRQISKFEDVIEVLKNEELVVIQVGIENESRKAAGLGHKKIVVDHTLMERTELKMRLMNRLASFEHNKEKLVAQMTKLREEHEQRTCEINQHRMELKNICALFRSMRTEFDLELKTMNKNYQNLNEQKNNAGQLLNAMDNEFLELTENLEKVNTEISIAETKTKELITQIQNEKTVQELILAQTLRDQDEHLQNILQRVTEYEDSARKVTDECSELDADLGARKVRITNLNEEFDFENDELCVLVMGQYKDNEMEVQGMEEAREADDNIKMIEGEIEQIQDEVDSKENELESEILAHEKEMEECGRIQPKLDILRGKEIELVKLIEEEKRAAKVVKEGCDKINSLKFQRNQLYIERYSVEFMSRLLKEKIFMAKNELKMANLELEYLRTSELQMNEEHDKLSTELSIKMKEIMGFLSKIDNKDEQKRIQPEKEKKDDGSIRIIKDQNNEFGSDVPETAELSDKLIVVSKPLSKTKITMEEIESASKSKSDLSPLKKETIPKLVLVQDQDDDNISLGSDRTLIFPLKKEAVTELVQDQDDDNISLGSDRTLIFPLKKEAVTELDQCEAKCSAESYTTLTFTKEKQGNIIRNKLANFFDNLANKKDQGAGVKTKIDSLTKTLVFPNCPKAKGSVETEMVTLQPQPNDKQGSSNSIKKKFTKVYENITRKKIEGRPAYPTLPLVLPSTSTSASSTSDINCGNLNLGLERVMNWDVKNSAEAGGSVPVPLKRSVLHAPLKSIIKNGYGKQLKKDKKVTFNSYVKVKWFHAPPRPWTSGHSASDLDSDSSDSDYEPATKKKANDPSSSSTPV